MDHSLEKFGSEEQREGGSRGRVEFGGSFPPPFFKFRRDLLVDVFKS